MSERETRAVVSDQERQVEGRVDGGRADWHPAGVWGLVLATYYAVFVRFYQAAGGRVGMVGDPLAAEPTWPATGQAC